MQILKSPSVDARAEADRLIAGTRLNSAEFPVVLANHLPMVLEALCQLGASAERLAEFADTYADQNERDFEALQHAAAVGRISVESGL